MLERVLPILMVIGSILRLSTADGAEPLVSPHVRVPVQIHLAVQWKPQSQFAGYYMARDRGFYQEAGMHVKILHADAERDSLRMLRDGTADVATAFLSDGLMASPEVVQVAQLVQRSNLMIVAWRRTGISDPSDLNGKRVSFWQGAFSAAFDAFFNTHQVRVIPIPQYYSIGLFLKQGVDACAAMEYNEFHRIWQAGIDMDQIQTFLMRDHGLGFPEDGLYVRKGWDVTHREMAVAFRKATLSGWRYARTHPDEALDGVLKEAHQAGVSANRPHERWMLDHVLDSIFISGKPEESAGRLDPRQFDTTITVLTQAGLLPVVPEFSAFAPLEGDPS